MIGMTLCSHYFVRDLKFFMFICLLSPFPISGVGNIYLYSLSLSLILLCLFYWSFQRTSVLLSINFWYLLTFISLLASTQHLLRRSLPKSTFSQRRKWKKQKSRKRCVENPVFLRYLLLYLIF